METRIFTGLDGYGKVIKFLSEAKNMEKLFKEKSLQTRISVSDTSKTEKITAEGTSLPCALLIFPPFSACERRRRQKGKE